MNDPAGLLLARLQEGTEAHGALAEFCRRSGIPRKTVENWLRGTTIPTTAIGPIAKGLDLEPWQLLKPSDAKDLPPLAAEIVRLLPSLNDEQMRALLTMVQAFGASNHKKAQGLPKQKQSG